MARAAVVGSFPQLCKRDREIWLEWNLALRTVCLRCSIERYHLIFCLKTKDENHKQVEISVPNHLLIHSRKALWQYIFHCFQLEHLCGRYPQYLSVPAISVKRLIQLGRFGVKFGLLGGQRLLRFSACFLTRGAYISHINCSNIEGTKPEVTCYASQSKKRLI